MLSFKNAFRRGILRRNTSLTSTPATRFLSIQCRGSPISREDVFRYTNGRFLADEVAQYAKRYVQFDLDKLCDLVASVSGTQKSRVCKIDKMEGGFSKALLMMMENGSEVIAKIPCSNAGRPMYSTASEVAVLNFVRAHTTIPVPKILAWNSDISNPVGAEYIIMEKVPGVQIFKVWDEMDESKRVSIIKRLTQWENELAAIQFPAYGNLYHKSSLHETEMVPLDSAMDPRGEFCVGPSCDPSWLIQPGQRLLPDVTCGPWTTLSDMGMSLVQRSISRAHQSRGKKSSAFPHGSIEEHLSLLGVTKKAIPTIASSPKLLDNSQPVMWHTDLHMGNIFVSENDPEKVTGFIDWQNTSINPCFLQARWPVFLNPPPDYQEGQVMPSLPEDFEQMDDEEKEIALYNKAKATWSKAYEVANFLNNRRAWRAMQAPAPLKELFRRCGETWDEGIVPLRATLIEVFLNQKDIGFGPRVLSLNFTQEQIASHEQDFTAYEEWHGMCKFVKDTLDTDDEGWIAPGRDLEEIKSRNKMLLNYYISNMTSNKSPEEVERMWPFLEEI